MLKRTNKSKEDLQLELKKKAKLEANKILARKVFPFVENLKTVYDAETVLGAISGYLALGLLQSEQKLVVSDLKIEMPAEKDKEINDALVAIMGLIQNEPAKEAERLIAMMGENMKGFLAQQALKGPMSQIKLEDYIAS